MIKKKKYFIGIGLAILIIFGIYKINIFLDRIENSDPEYNTIYAQNFNEELFQNRLIGKSKNEIIEIIGNPLSKTKLKYFDAILYTNFKDSVYLKENSISVRLKGYSENVKYTFISFDSIGNVQNVMIRGYTENEEELKKSTKSEIFEKFGKPQKQMLCNCKCMVYSYSEIKEGGYSGKHPIINIRNLVFDKKNKLIKVIKKVGSTYSKYDEICSNE
ncbi:hypothetical protein ACFSX9_02655 [Flavobacterium ardleyense]|uniref:Uncharacterized protein n=1 Tax=Flavobacterium ardleyense TaxID=2038737 RepID=A0ABW5Z4E6_9FLAO